MSRTYSLRRRLTLVLALGFTAVILVAGAGLMPALRATATAQFDTALLAKARAMEALTEQEAGHIEFDYKPKLAPEFEREDAPEYFEFWLDDGSVLLRSRRLEVDLPRDGATPTAPVVRDLELPDGRPGRVVLLSFVPGKHKDIGDPHDDPTEPGITMPLRGLVLAMARDRIALDATLAGMQWSVLLAGLAAVALAALLAWRALAAGFRPITTIAAQVGELHADSLSGRVSPAQLPSEIAPVVDQLNALLSRLNTSFTRQRQFADNLAHEMRTPIAELRSLAAVGARWPEDQAAVVGYFGDVSAIAGRMDGIVADLLLLARCRAGVEHATRFPLHLRQLVTTTWGRLADRASARGLRLTMRVPHDLVVASDPGKLGIMIANLFDNAVTYAREGSEVECRATRTAAGVELELRNAAEPLAASELASVAEPFWRKDQARAGDRHVGLGLALVSALGALLQVRIVFTQDEDSTFSVRLIGLAPASATTDVVPLGRVP